jgi:hypothetical protein
LTVWTDCTGESVVGKNNPGPYEHTIANDRRFVNERTILNLAVFSHDDACPNIRTPADDAGGTDCGFLPDLGKAPYFRADT